MLPGAVLLPNREQGAPRTVLPTQNEGGAQGAAAEVGIVFEVVIGDEVVGPPGWPAL